MSPGHRRILVTHSFVLCVSQWAGYQQGDGELGHMDPVLEELFSWQENRQEKVKEASGRESDSL